MNAGWLRSMLVSLVCFFDVMRCKSFVSVCFMLILLYSLAETVAVRTVNRQCSSGLQAVADVAAAIKAGFYDIG